MKTLIDKRGQLLFSYRAQVVTGAALATGLIASSS